MHTVYTHVRKHAIDIVVLIIIWSCVALTHFVYNVPYNTFFTERDPDLSYPYHFGVYEAIPDWLVIFLSIPLSMLIIGLVQLFFRYVLKLSHMAPRALNHLIAQLAILEAMGMTILITEFLKSFIGRKRPNFFAYCNYQGYRDAMDTGNFTSYFALTTPYMPGNLAHCWDKEYVRDAQASFPSGHSSSIACGFGFVGLFITYILNRAYTQHNMLKGMVAFIMFFIAIVIAGTRPRDYWHNYDDILAGAAIGLCSATFAFLLNFGTTIPPRSTVEPQPNEHLVTHQKDKPLYT